MPPPFLYEGNIFPFAKQCAWPIIKSVEHKLQVFDQNGSTWSAVRTFSQPCPLSFRRNEKRQGLVSVSAKLTLWRHGTGLSENCGLGPCSSICRRIFLQLRNEISSDPRENSYRGNCHSHKVYGIFPIWQFLQEIFHMYFYHKDICLSSLKKWK